MKYLLLILLMMAGKAEAQKKDKRDTCTTCCSWIDIPSGYAISFDRINKVYLVNDWYGEKRFLTHDMMGWHFHFPEIQKPIKFKTLCAAKRAFYYGFLGGQQKQDLVTVEGTKD